MQRLGVIGGIGPESTIAYYRAIIAAGRQHGPASTYPPVLINSIDLQKVLQLVADNALTSLTAYLAGEVEALAKGGAALGLIAANTPHIVFDEVRERSSIPMVSIVEATCDAARAIGLNRIGLFGTRFTMEARFYPDVFSSAGIELVVPREDEQAYIHDKYMSELVKGVFLPRTRESLLRIVEMLKDREGVEAVILAGTELPLILTDRMASGIPLLDTTQIHVEAAVKRLWSQGGEPDGANHDWTTARHEAGHAVAALHYDCGIKWASIEQGSGTLGTTHLGVSKAQHAIVLFCGPLAEREWDEFLVQPHEPAIKLHGSDRDSLEYLQAGFGDLDCLQSEAWWFLGQRSVQEQIDRVAHALLERKRLTRDEVAEIAGFSQRLCSKDWL